MRRVLGPAATAPLTAPAGLWAQSLTQAASQLSSDRVGKLRFQEEEEGIFQRLPVLTVHCTGRKV